MKNLLIISAKDGLIFDPREIVATPEESFEEWLESHFDFRLFHTEEAEQAWIDRQAEVAPDRYWARLSLPDMRRRP